MNPLARLWNGMACPSRSDMSGMRMPDVGELAGGATCYLALDTNGFRHILLSRNDHAALPPGLRTRGLRVSFETLTVGEHAPREYLDIACEDSSLNGIFSALAADVQSTLGRFPTAAFARVLELLRTWKWFWSVRRDSLSREKAIGLFGELWFLLLWGRTLDRAKVTGWTGPNGALRDFEWGNVFVEVKTRVGRSGPTTHRITSLDQLDDPETGDLFLFSLDVVPDDHALNSLASVVSEIQARLAPDPLASECFSEGLSAYGYSPAFADEHSQTFRVVAEHLYHVRPGFPRLTRKSFPAGVPSGVLDISYLLDMEACDRWLVARSPTEAGATTTLVR